MYQLFSEADEIVAHYGDKFDARYIRGRGLIHGLPPPPPVKQVDTYKIAKARFNLNSNKLDYLASVLGIGRKIKTTEALWEGCENGDLVTINKMVRYNNQDVDLLDEVHTRLQPYAASVYSVMRGDVCPYCKGTRLQSRGMDPKRQFRRFQCLDCFKWPRRAA